MPFGIDKIRTSQTVASTATLRHVASVFTKIIRGELPCHEVHRDDVCIAFLSINPLATGHTLVVPLVETDHWLDLPDTTSSHLFHVAKRIGEAQRTLLKPRRVGLIIAGFEVAHCHIHVVPTQSMADLDFANAATTPDHDRLAEVARGLRESLGR